MDFNISRISDNIYLGGLMNNQYSDNFRDYIIYNNIKSILTIWDYSNLDYGLLNTLNISLDDYMYINLKDDISSNIYIYLDIAYDFIKDKVNTNKNILIHCYAGMSRSATLLIYYYIKEYNLSLKDAYSVIYYKITESIKNLF